MRYRLSALIGSAVLVLAGLVVGGASPVTAAPTAAPTPGPTLTCPPALPISGSASAVTPTSVTIRYSMILTPPCGYNPPVTVTLFASQGDAQQWVNPVAEAVSGPERSGEVTIGGLTPDTAYWIRFTADGRHDPYVFPSVRTAPVATCAATVRIDSAWTGGFVATVTVRNVGDEALSGWRVAWTWPGDERIQSLWNAVAQGDATVGNASYNAAVAPGASTTFGMLVAASGTPAAIDPACGH